MGDTTNTLLSPVDKSFRQKNTKEISEWNGTIDQIVFTDIYRLFIPAAAQYRFFSEADGIFSDINHILVHKASLSKYKKAEITPCILSDNGIKTSPQ
jgi:hypothetical protein